MKALKSLNKSIPKVLKMLSKQFGVQTAIYTPESLDSMYGGKGSNIIYSTEPVYDELMLIPSIIKENISGSQGIIDPFLDGDEIILYLSGATYLPDYSKVVVSMYNASAILAYKIMSCSVVKDDQFIFLRKYLLTPISDLQQLDVPDIELLDMVDREAEIEDDLEIPILRETVTTEVSKLSWTYSPIEEA